MIILKMIPLLIILKIIKVCLNNQNDYFNKIK